MGLQARYHATLEQKYEIKKPTPFQKVTVALGSLHNAAAYKWKRVLAATRAKNKSTGQILTTAGLLGLWLGNGSAGAYIFSTTLLGMGVSFYLSANKKSKTLQKIKKDKSDKQL